MSWSLLWTFLVPLAATPIVLLAGLSIFQEKLLFIPEPLAVGHSFDFKPAPEEIWISVDDQKIHSLYFQTAGAKTLILYFHGNAGNLQNWAPVAAELSQSLKTNVWIMDYPGFGKSEGRLRSENQLNQIAQAFADQIPQRPGIERVVIYGRSIGTGPASFLAGSWGESSSRPHLTGVILETPFASLVDLIHDYAGWFPETLMKYRFYNHAALQKFQGPILILHGRNDEVIAFRHGEALAEALAERGSVTFTEITDGQHNDLSDHPEYWQSLQMWWQENQEN